MTWPEALLAITLTVWFVLSAAGQFSYRRIELLRRWDCFSLIPIWTFFAPNPGHTDYHLIYRDRSADGKLGVWTEIPLIARRRWFTALWNPQKRGKKIVSDVLNSFGVFFEHHENARLPRDEALQLVMLTTPYLIVLNLVSAVPRTLGVQARQFAVVERFGFVSNQPPEPVFVSPFHRLDSSLAGTRQPNLTCPNSRATLCSDA
jgi:hypothetical protein